MKKWAVFIIIAWLLIPGFGFSQTERYDSVMEELTYNFNQGKFDAIFNQFAPEMKAALPIQETRQFFTGVLDQAGRIQDSEFKGFLRGSYATYKTNFDRMVLAVNLSVTEEGKINGLSIHAYEEEEIESRGVVNSLDGIPQSMAELIFKEIKYFPDQTELALAVIRDGNPEYYGIRKENDTIRTIQNKDAVFEIGSLTKVFTATVLATFVEAGKLALKDPINPFYPFKFHKGHQISFESLANHTSGLPALPGNFDFTNEENPYTNYGIEKLNTFLKDSLRIDYRDPGYAYSNLGAGLLAHSLELASRIPFKELVRNRILKRFDMNETYLDNGDDLKGLVKGRDFEGKVTANWDFDVLFGAGGMLSTTADLVKFVQAQFNSENRDLALTRRLTHKINEELGIGLGWHITRSVGHNDWYWQNGGTGGYRSALVFDPQTRDAVVVLSNVSAFHPRDENIDRVAFNLMRQMMKQ